MEIRARINLEVSKFIANTKVVVAQFRSMTTGAERYSNNVDHYAKRSLDRTKTLNNERLKDTSKVGQAVAAREKQIADDIYSKRMQALQRFLKDKTKLELEAVRKGSTGEVTGSVRPATRVRGGNIVQGIDPRKARELAAYEQKAAKQLAALERQAAKENLARIEAGRKATARMYAERNNAIKAEAAAQEALAKRAIAHIEAQIAKRRQLAAAQAKKDNFNSALDGFRSDEFKSRLASTRYALYDISNRMAMFGTATAAALGVAVKAAIEFESAFTSVERTTGLALNSMNAATAEAAQRLKSTLIELSTEIPITFQEIAKIATLGAQLGIAADSVDEFAETVARFSAVTGLSVDEVGMSFGRLAQLMNVPVEQFENLSSAIAYTGVNSVATDQEILRMSESISAATTQAGLAADETIGFAAALASLKVRPEEARGVLTRLFREFDLSVSAGGSSLDDLSKVIGETSEDAAKLWEQDPSQFVQAFLRGAQATGSLNETITALGITNTRELNVISRLAQNQDVLTQTLADSAEQYAAGTFASEAYGLVVDDLASKITMLQNELAAFGASIGELVAGPISFIVDSLRAFIDFLNGMPVIFKYIGTGIVALTAGFALMAAMLTGGIAALLAMRLAMDNLSIGGQKANLSLSTLKALLISMVPNAGAATTVTGALANSLNASAAAAGRASIAMKAFQVATGPVGWAILGISAAWIAIESSINGAKEEQKKYYEAAGGASAFADALKKDAEAISDGAKVYGEITLSAAKLSKEEQKLTLASKEAAVEREKANRHTEEGAAAYADAVESLRLFKAQMDGTNDSIEENTILLGANTRALIVNSMQDLWNGLANLDPQTKQALEQAGFDAAKFIDAGMAKPGGAREYLNNLDLNVDDIAFQDIAFFADSTTTLGAVKGMYDYADAISNTVTAIESGTTAEGYREAALADTTGSLGEVEDQTISLSEQLKTLVSGLGAEEAANQAVNKSFQDMISGMKGTSGEMYGMSEAATNNMSAFKSFMDASIDASIAAGTGAQGAASDVASAMNTMAQEGYDTADAFSVSKDLFVNAFYEMSGASGDAKIKINGEMVSIREALNDAGDLQGIKDVINGFYAAKLAAEGGSFALYNAWNAALAALDGTNKVDEDLDNTTKSAGKAKTALEKLQETLKKLYGWTNKKIALNESIASLGDSMRENGRTFSVWSESGRENVSSLLDVIDQLAVESNGDLQKFANSLASMRAALVQSGAPASALKLIDDALKKIGKTGKATTKQVQQFVNVLGSAGDEISTLQAVNAAIGDLASTMRDQFDAYFYQSDMIDSITLGWLDLADAADTAREQIKNAEESIRDARLEIEASKAAIDKLTANKGTLQYQLAIALKYGDTLRADELKAEIAELEAQIAEERNNIVDSQGDIADAQQEIADANGELGSNPTARQQIERNMALRDMAGRYLDVASAALLNAEEGADLNVIMEDQIGAFVDMAREAGFTEEEIQSIAGVMRDVLTKAINDIPKNPKVTVTSETSAALQKVKKFVQDANAALAGINSVNVQVTTGGGSTGGGGSMYYSQGGLVSGRGSGTSDSILAKVSNGEFVMKAAAVNRYGVDFMNAINNMQSFPMARVNVPAVAGTGSQTVYLSTEDRQLLRAAIDRPIALYTDNATIAKSANDGNRILAKRGTR